MIKRKGGNKYGAKKTEIDGLKFDSKVEGKFYEHLKQLKENGDVLEFECQPKYLLQEAFKHHGKTIRKIEYIADFRVVYANGEEWVYDIKGMKPLADNIIKVKMLKYLNRDMNFSYVKWYQKEWVYF
ncbi:MAG: DUF1064 domain-containing protein [Peptostreptococcaceae bacterium]